MNFLLAGVLIVGVLVWMLCEAQSGSSWIAFAGAIFLPFLFFTCMIIGLLIEMNWQWQKMLALYPGAFGLIFCGLLITWGIPFFSRIAETPKEEKRT